MAEGLSNVIKKSIAHFIDIMSQRDPPLLHCQKMIQSIDMVKSMADWPSREPLSITLLCWVVHYPRMRDMGELFEIWEHDVDLFFQPELAWNISK